MQNSLRGNYLNHKAMTNVAFISSFLFIFSNFNIIYKITTIKIIDLIKDNEGFL